MSKKTSKSGVISAIVITVVLLALLNVCTFAIPFNKVDLGVHFAAYGCAEFVILVEMILVISQLFIEEDSNQKILGLPIIYFGYVTTVLQLMITAVFYLVNAFVALPAWVIILVEVLIIGFGVIQIAKGFFFKTRNEQYHQHIANTKFMDEFRARLKALQKINKNENIEKALSDLVDTALGSDPVTNDKTVDSESKLLSLLQELDESIKDGSETDAREAITKIKNALLERNVLCKAGK